MPADPIQVESARVPASDRSQVKPLASHRPSGEAPAPIRRHRIGRGSYEDPAEEKRRKRRPGKTGRPGR